MSNPQLNEVQLKKARNLLVKIRKDIVKLAQNNSRAIFAFRRKIYKELMYDERSKPMVRKKLKLKMWKKLNGVCPICKRKLPKRGADLDRIHGAIGGYTEKNVRLIHFACHIKDQKRKEFN